MRWAVIDAENTVVNVIEWDGVAPWAPPEGCRAIESDTLNPGDTAPPADE